MAAASIGTIIVVTILIVVVAYFIWTLVSMFLAVVVVMTFLLINVKVITSVNISVPGAVTGPTTLRSMLASFPTSSLLIYHLMITTVLVLYFGVLIR